MALKDVKRPICNLGCLLATDSSQVFSNNVGSPQSRSQLALQRMGWEPPWRMGVAVTPTCKEITYWKNKERDEFGGFGHEFFYYHALFVGNNVTNTL